MNRTCLRKRPRNISNIPCIEIPYPVLGCTRPDGEKRCICATGRCKGSCSICKLLSFESVHKRLGSHSEHLQRVAMLRRRKSSHKVGEVLRIEAEHTQFRCMRECPEQRPVRLARFCERPSGSGEPLDGEVVELQLGRTG
eukprot:gnl/TRDRNA2_/TRDRNA2_175618_c21_seq1.p2 gnl/TRDRNA2_/TRDRNA2_175618_c21~~gnl/TRDRNA2_/TRDRNA2_175618_c21_seq1.p2  ORF type:complete len:140 (-),score=8.18 gnl/TRDRNA2_/TRDRNA2_175618_c21_seq1:144-563(-)